MRLLCACTTTDFASLKQYFSEFLLFCIKRDTTVASYTLKNNVLFKCYFWIGHVLPRLVVKTELMTSWLSLPLTYCHSCAFKAVPKKRSNSFAKKLCWLPPPPATHTPWVNHTAGYIHVLGYWLPPTPWVSHTAGYMYWDADYPLLHGLTIWQDTWIGILAMLSVFCKVLFIVVSSFVLGLGSHK